VLEQHLHYTTEFSQQPQTHNRWITDQTQ